MTNENTNAATATAPTPAPLTSEKLQSLQNDYRKQWAEVTKISDPFSPEAQAANMALWKIQGEIKAEQAALNKAAADAKISEMRNERLKLVANLLDAHAANLAVHADKKATPEAKAEAETKFAEAKQVVENELLAKFAGSKPAKTADGEAKARRNSGNSAEIVEMYLNGKTHAEIESAGYARSTVWHAIDKYKKANNIS